MIPLKDENPTRGPAVVTVVLILINIGVYLFVQPPAGSEDGVRFTYEYAAVPCEVTQGRPLELNEIRAAVAGDDDACDTASPSEAPFPGKGVWLAVLFSMFLHGGLLHIGGNMLFLWIFGNNVEDHLGPVRYVGFYLLGGLAATAAHVAVQPDSTVPLIGASGAIAAVMGAYLVWFPTARIRSLVTLLFFITLIEVPAYVLLAFWFVSQFFIDPNAGVASMAHVGGFVFGVLVAALVRSSQAARRVMWAHGATAPWADPNHWRDDDPPPFRGYR